MLYEQICKATFFMSSTTLKHLNHPESSGHITAGAQQKGLTDSSPCDLPSGRFMAPGAAPCLSELVPASPSAAAAAAGPLPKSVSGPVTT